MDHTQQSEINNCLKVLRKGGTILYPTDTIWGIGCDATNRKAVDKVYKIKKRLESKSLIVLLDDIKKISAYVDQVQDIAKALVETVESPLTIIYPGAKNLAKNLIAEDGSIAIRIINNEFCSTLIREFRKPIVSTSANISGQPAPLIFKCVPQEIVSQVDYIVKIDQEDIRETKPSTIVKIQQNGEFEIIRR